MTSCPRLTFKRTSIEGGNLWGMQVAAYDGSKEVGVIFARVEQDGDPYVSWIEVDETRCRQGIATRLYEELAKDVCAGFKRPLTSDTERTARTQAFWAKQVAKGRARCLAPGEPSGGPAINNPDMAAAGRGGCLAYQLNNCNVGSLAGRPRRRRRRR